MTIEISIIVPMYNAQEYILRCLQSIKSQTCTNYEVLLINDGSTDQTEQICRKFIVANPKFKLFTKKNDGVAVARNIGIDVAVGNYIVFIDADDYVETNYLEILFTEIVTSDCCLVCCGYFDHSVYGDIVQNNYGVKKQVIDNVNEFIPLFFSKIGGVLWDKIYKSSIIKDNNIKMNLNIYFFEDTIFILDYLSFVDKISLSMEPLYHYNRLNDQSFTRKMNHQWTQNIIQYNKYLEFKLSLFAISNNFINMVVSKNINNYVFFIFRHQLVNYKISEQYKIINSITAENYLRNNCNFKSLSLISKLFYFLFKRKLSAGIIFYAWFLNILFKIRAKIKNL